MPVCAMNKVQIENIVKNKLADYSTRQSNLTQGVENVSIKFVWLFRITENPLGDAFGGN